MNKKLLIAGFFATIMLLVPLSSITGASVNALNTTEEVIEEPYPVIPYYLLDDLYNAINNLLVNYGDDPEVVLLCEEILEMIGGPYDTIFCNAIFKIFITIVELVEEKYDDEYPPHMQSKLVLALGVLMVAVWCVMFHYCGEPPEGTLNLNKITYDTTIINELIQSNEVNMCPCSQQANI